MKKDMPLEGLRWSRDSGSALYDTPQNGRSRTGWGGHFLLNSRPLLIAEQNLYNHFPMSAEISSRIVLMHGVRI